MKMKPAKKSNKERHYINNHDFSHAVYEYVLSVAAAKKKGEEIPTASNYIGECLREIATKLANRPNFATYSYKDEMIHDAIENCVKALLNYDLHKATRTGSPNGFSYFSQISYFAFIRRITKEKKQHEIKQKIRDSGSVGNFADFTDDGYSESIVNSIRNKSSNDFTAFDDDLLNESWSDRVENAKTWHIPKIDRTLKKTPIEFPEEEEIQTVTHDLFDDE